MCVYFILFFLMYGCAHSIVVIGAISEIRLTSSNYSLGHIMHITLQFIAVICSVMELVFSTLCFINILKQTLETKKHENTHDLL